jgi:glycosyltransferase involved in cell wall biosynthesis
MASTRPLFSVVIPAYNAARWLEQTLASWACQTVRNFEVIVVDDGSEDDTVALARTFEERLPLRVISEPHSGAPAHPCNVGARAAQGDLIVQCDADDLAAPDRLAGIEYAWRKAGRADCLIISDFCEVDADNRVLRSHVLADYCALQRARAEPLADDVALLSPDAAFTALLEAAFIRPCSAAMSKTAFERAGGFNEALRNAQDYDLYARLLQKYPLVWVRRILGLYRIRADSISSRSAIDLAPSRLAVFRSLLNLPLTPTQYASVRRWLAANYETLGYAYGDCGELRQSLVAYCQAFRQRPALLHIRGMAASVAKRLIRARPGHGAGAIVAPTGRVDKSGGQRGPPAPPVLPAS